MGDDFDFADLENELDMMSDDGEADASDSNEACNSAGIPWSTLLYEERKYHSCVNI